ncbi:Uncharacterised protein [uncultured archaeon]|nr:Uncharacterised protein [uncultured archaeon]
MKRGLLFVLGVLVLSGFVFAESLVGSGETYVNTVSVNSSNQTSGFVSSNSNLGLSILILAIIFATVYWLVKRSKKKVKRK